LSENKNVGDDSFRGVERGFPGVSSKGIMARLDTFLDKDYSSKTMPIISQYFKIDS
jgi:hypothetical protein